MGYYERVYWYLWYFSTIQVHGVLLCRLLAPVLLMVLIWISRLVSSVMVKFFAIAMAMILYFFPNVVGLFAWR